MTGREGRQIEESKISFPMEAQTCRHRAHFLYEMEGIAYFNAETYSTVPAYVFRMGC